MDDLRQSMNEHNVYTDDIAETLRVQASTVNKWMNEDSHLVTLLKAVKETYRRKTRGMYGFSCN